MLGLIGFIAAVIIISLFVVSCHYAYPQLDKKTSQSFRSAFILLALVMLICALAILASASGDQLDRYILAADVALLLGSGYLLSLFVNMKRPIIVLLVGSIAAILIVSRAYVFPPEAYIENGLLHFNLTGVPRYVLSGLILGLWFPATIVVALKSARTIKVAGFDKLLILAYTTLVISTAAFFSARNDTMIIATFSTMLLIFAVISIANVITRKITNISARTPHGQ